MSGWGKEVGGRAARLWAAGLAMTFLAVGAANRDLEAAAFGVFTALGLAATLFRRGLVGRVGLGLLALDTLAWMVPAAFVNVTNGDAVAGVAIPATLVVFSLGLLLLILGVPPRPVLAIAGAAVVVTVLGLVVATSDDDSRPVASATVTMRNVAFNPEAIEATGSIAVRNRDLFWHTFTVEDLDLEVAVPTGATRVITLEAPPGTYDFVCAIPGHEGAGMKGTITLR